MKEEAETQRSKRKVYEGWRGRWVRSKESVCARRVEHVTDMTARFRGGRGSWVKSREGGSGRRGVSVIEEEGG